MNYFKCITINHRMEEEKANSVQWQPLSSSLSAVLIQWCHMTTFSGNTFTDQIWVFQSTPDPGFVSPIRSDPGFVSPIRSHRSHLIQGLSTAQICITSKHQACLCNLEKTYSHIFFQHLFGGTVNKHDERPLFPLAIPNTVQIMLFPKPVALSKTARTSPPFL